MRACLALFVLAAAASADTIDVGRGPVTVFVPSAYDPGVPTAVVMLLHGYGASGVAQEAYMRFRPESERLGFLYLHPDGTRDPGGNRFWNATNACCDFYGSGVDDSAYLRALIDEMERLYNVDPRRIYLVGHSNGSFMSFRMACDHSEKIAAIAGLAGATYVDEDLCAPASPAHVLHLHGTLDTTIFYGGGCISGLPQYCYPGAVESVETWAAYDGCAPVGDANWPPRDVTIDVAGAETSVTKYRDGCASGGSAELWTITSGGHVPRLTASFGAQVAEWLLAHPKPCAGDFNGDGRTDVFDFLAFQGAFGNEDGAADLAPPFGVLDVFDFLAFQNRFSEGC